MCVCRLCVFQNQEAATTKLCETCAAGGVGDFCELHPVHHIHVHTLQVLVGSIFFLDSAKHDGDQGVDGRTPSERRSALAAVGAPQRPTALPDGRALLLLAGCPPRPSARCICCSHPYCCCIRRCCLPELQVTVSCKTDLSWNIGVR